MLKKAVLIAPIILGVFFLFSSHAGAKPVTKGEDKSLYSRINEIVPAHRRTSDASPFLGDKESQKYYPQNCPGYRDLPEGRRQKFQSAEEAEKAHFKKADECP